VTKELLSSGNNISLPKESDQSFFGKIASLFFSSPSAVVDTEPPEIDDETKPYIGAVSTQQ